MNEHMQETIDYIRRYIVDAQCRDGNLYQDGKTALANLETLVTWINAVPVEAIRFYQYSSNPVVPVPYDEDVWNARRDAESAVCEWLNEVQAQIDNMEGGSDD